ncbi:hypothetical protein EMIHUDRAFT_109264 [Emiliania huxleyi CCMP1516]|uniref:PDZ domain-containing protein n=2 Tax=Emiliania huxleyi TaxID=2903 RepID=A0A0D3KS37_EMIH1|nr:hypothetical protein EMIHUDRAFT_221839 [Emiliania huxleyi CCMP1516]XP_005791001.1 hypothetical protein EMIHUDRAFT_109264 [Emiliania huxleyi CCMP1516]EOD03704.1 hypothetical protein EMIHUDRAFT_221839 [Emiliania huxleyi CCMP1516]EOD38572.1 hypothetical protein EMIHUDRAFT_109264 [Emiliania huxleyi CCMP1516]|mmetsp:Transcript_22408/g.73358  ORF Transcript_22408/g.73358 Transcript_22408/m.73358 type:complete len:245 (-) Transcript_22408:115-849(-)|eukprot:XP_005756133.1 hypothetical protein EMIHUDRAFT_221839 [Emiliania huxleyi CCMP1516]
MLPLLLTSLTSLLSAWRPVPSRGARSAPAALSVRTAYARSVTLAKPLGIVLEERDGGGVRFDSFQEGGAAAEQAAALDIAPGDRLLAVEGVDVSRRGFDAVMALLVDAPSPLRLTVDDGLDTLDITPNLAKSLSADDAAAADQTVRVAVRETRRIVGASGELQASLGSLLRVEIVLGAGVRPDGRCLVRFFGIFTTDGGASTYSCNLSATGRRREDGSTEILALSAAKDEGWGQTIDLRRDAGS